MAAWPALAARLQAPAAYAALAGLLLGCGSIGDPRPPLVNLPQPVSDLKARQVGDSIQIAWTRPNLTTEGLDDDGTGEATLWKVDVPALPADLTAETMDTFRQPVATLGAGPPGEPISLDLPLDQWPVGQPTVLVVTVENRAGRYAGYSNPVPVHPLEPPSRPALRGVVPTEEGVTLTWREVRNAEVYAVERSVDEAGFAILDRATSSPYLDREIAWDEPHRYRLRPFRMSDAGPVEGPVSESVGVTPRDVFAPRAPRDLRAVRTASSVELSWLPNEERDLAGYRVLRGGTALSPTTKEAAFSDSTAATDTPYEYEVLAVDENGNESTLSETVFVAPIDARP